MKNKNNLADSLKGFDQQDHLIQGHVLKFMNQGKHHKDRGIICFLQQTYGNSLQSPDNFRGRNTVINRKGYEYRHENKPQFKYYSQKRYFSINGSTNQQLSKQIHIQGCQNTMKFHRKKGELGQFIQKNGWMNKTTKMMGFQRDDKARQLSNRDRNKRIQSLKARTNYENTTALKPITSGLYFQKMGSLTSRKMKMRGKRNEQAQRFSQSVQPRNIQTSKKVVSKVERQVMQQKMLQSSRNWSPSKSAKQKCQQFSRRFYSNKFQIQGEQEKSARQYDRRQKHEQSLEDWYRTTCSSNWVYQKKDDSQYQQTHLQPQFADLVTR